MDNKINLRMITLARESRGLTQAELAERLSIATSKMSRIEAGLLNISEAILEQLPAELNYPKDFFYISDDIYGMGLSGMGIIYYRRRQSLSMSSLNKIQAQMNIRRIHISRLLRSVEMTNKREMPFIDIDEYDGDACKIATHVRAAWRIPSGPLNNLTELIESAGGIVIKCDFGTDKIDALSQPGIPPLFFMNSRSPGDRLRFSLAHELGHIVMHKMPNDHMEKEADRFAAELLMPQCDIAPYLNYVDIRKLANLKPYWKVAMAALLFRAHDLGKMTKRRYQYLWTQMAPYKKREPSELDIPIEEPRLLGKIIDIYLNELKYKVSELSSLIFLFEQEAKSLYIQSSKASHLTVVK